jgi:hypothetical protein
VIIGASAGSEMAISSINDVAEEALRELADGERCPL